MASDSPGIKTMEQSLLKNEGNGFLLKILYLVLLSIEWVSEIAFFELQQFKKYSSYEPLSLRDLLEDLLHQNEMLSHERGRPPREGNFQPRSKADGIPKMAEVIG